MTKEQLETLLQESEDEFDKKFNKTITGFCGNKTEWHLSLKSKFHNFLKTQITKTYNQGLEEAVTLIGEDMGWEESEDHYREILGLPLKYKNAIQ